MQEYNYSCIKLLIRSFIKIFSLSFEIPVLHVCLLVSRPSLLFLPLSPFCVMTFCVKPFCFMPVCVMQVCVMPTCVTPFCVMAIFRIGLLPFSFGLMHLWFWWFYFNYWVLNFVIDIPPWRSISQKSFIVSPQPE